MSKQQIHAWVDQDVYLYLKSKEVNVSRTVNELLKNLIDFESDQLPEEIELINKLEVAKQNLISNKKDIEKYSAMLMKVREDNEEVSKKVAERSKAEKELGQRILGDL